MQNPGRFLLQSAGCLPGLIYDAVYLCTKEAPVHCDAGSEVPTGRLCWSTGSPGHLHAEERQLLPAAQPVAVKPLLDPSSCARRLLNKRHSAVGHLQGGPNIHSPPPVIDAPMVPAGLPFKTWCCLGCLNSEASGANQRCRKESLRGAYCYCIRV